MTDPVSFTSTTPRYALPHLFAGQAQKEFIVNEAHALIDALLHPAIEGEATEPPASPAEGDSWLVGSGATGDWTGKDGTLASLEAGTWVHAWPRDGLRVLDRATGQTLIFHGEWQRCVEPAAPTAGATVDSEARAAIVQLIDALRQARIFPQATGN